MTAQDQHARRVPRRLRLAEWLAFAGLVAAFVAALGPAERARSTYVWPPKQLPSESPTRLWYAPLLLSARIPESITARLPCSSARPLPGASDPPIVFSTARRPQDNGGLVVRQDGAELVVGTGPREVVRLPLTLAAAGTEGCSYALRVAGGRWSVSGGPDDVELDLSQQAGSMPVVNGMFSELDLRESGLAVETTTRAHRTRPTVLQRTLWVVAILAVLAALALVTIGRRSRRFWKTIRTGIGDAAAEARALDAAVLLALAGWWILAPAHWDDGWVVARQTGFWSSGGFSDYYHVFGANLPNGYWLEWAQHWLTENTTSLLVLRLPALLCLVATWVVCRWVLFRALERSENMSAVTGAALACAFLAGATAWGMTLRPEPIAALLVTGALACAIRFAEYPTAMPLAIASLLVALAVTGHHSGLVAVAPFIAVGPRILSWSRSNVPAAATILTAFFATALVLAFVGSDLRQRADDASLFRTYGVQDAWFDELRRYAYLSDVFGGPPMRRASVALMVLAILSFVLRRRPSQHRLMDVYATSLALSLGLLLLVPSKWPWHFGTLLGVAAVTVAAETARLRGDASRASGWQARPFLAVAAAIVAIAWTWGPRETWSLLDLRAHEWTLGVERTVSLSAIAVLVPVLVLGALAVWARARKQRPSLAPWRTAALAAPLLVVPVAVFTASVLAVDALESSWTVARQNAGALRGDSGCGLADELLIPDTASMRALHAVDGSSGGGVPAWVPPGPVSSLRRIGLGPTGAGSASSPWFALPHGRNVGVFAAGSLGIGDRLSVEWGRTRDGRVVALRATSLTSDLRPRSSGISSWRFLAQSELRRPSPGANAVRIRLESDSAPGATVALTVPVTYSTRQLRSLLAADGARALVNPAYVTYMPCATQPAFRHGVAEVPRYVLSVPSLSDLPVGYPTSPFRGVADVFDLERVTFADSPRPPGDLGIFRVTERIPGAALVPPVRSTTDS
jgi:arabinosyltransferase C